MRGGRVSVEGEAEEIVVSPSPRYRQRDGKRSNPYSTRGLDEFQRIYAKLSVKREYIASKSCVSEAMVKFVFSKKGWIPVVIRGRDQGNGKKRSGEGAAGLSILGPVEKNNIINHEHEDQHNSKAKKIRNSVSMDNGHSNRPGRSVEGSDSFYKGTNSAMAHDSRVGAIVMLITLLCFFLYGRMCVILFTGAWLYLLPMLRKCSEGMEETNRNTDMRMVYLQSREYQKKVIMNGFLDRTRKR